MPKHPDDLAHKAAHSIQRAKERYGLDLTREDLNAIRDCIFVGNSKRLKWPSKRGTETYRVTVKGVSCVVAFDNYAEAVATFLTDLEGGGVDMISIFGLIILGLCGWAAYNLYLGTTSVFARALTLTSIGLLAWSLVAH